MGRKLPAFQFYPGDWLKDAALRSVSHAAKGVYIDMICLMFECEDRGVLATGGSPWSDERIAAAVGGDQHATLACIAELLAMGVVSRNSFGAIFSRRMVRDEQFRQDATERKRRERIRSRDSPPNGTSHARSHANVTRLLPSSSSTSVSPSSPPGTLGSAGIPADQRGEEEVSFETLVSKLRSLGVNDAQSAVDGARSRGVTESEIARLIEVWRGHPNAWSAGALHYRIVHARPREDAGKGWPVPNKAADDSAKKRQASEESRRATRRYEIIRDGRSQKKTDDAITAELAAEGLTWE